MIKLLATDLDRTLLPNGTQPYDHSMPLFKKILEELTIPLAFVSGRHLSLVENAIKEYDTPQPRYIIGDVGTTMYICEGNRCTRDESWDEVIRERTSRWDIPAFRKAVRKQDSLRLQEEDKQNVFKLSYYIDNLERAEYIVEKVRESIELISSDASIVYSVDETIGVGLLDVLPKSATKEGALEHLRKKLAAKKDEVVYCGDSGNDLLPLTKGYYAIVVRNVLEEVREEVMRIAHQKGIEDHIYFAKGNDSLNGYYVSGIIEGLVALGFVSKKYAESRT